MNYSRQKLLATLQPGDLIAYKPTGFFGILIYIKTWHRISHVEVYIGEGTSYASRDGVGVDIYSMRVEDIYGVYRPKVPIDLAAGKKWFQTVQGNKYDWAGIFAFAGIGKAKSGKEFCSEFATMFYRACGLELFSKDEAAGKIAPFQLTINPMLEKVKLT